MSDFRYEPSPWAPFRDRAACERVRSIKREDFCKHANPGFHIEVLPDDELGFRRIWDLFSRIRDSSEKRQPLTLILCRQGHPLSLTHAQIVFRHLDIRARDLGVARRLGRITHAHPAADAVPSRRLGNGSQCRYVSLADYDRPFHSRHAISSVLGRRGGWGRRAAQHTKISNTKKCSLSVWQWEEVQTLLQLI